MTLSRGPIGLLLSLFLYSCLCQAAEQDYGHPVDFRLAENASLLKLSPERLLKARIALRRATEAMDIITPRSGASLGPLVSGWKRLDPACLPGALAYLYEKSRQEALQADRAFGYEWSTLEAVLLLTELAAIDPDRATRLGEEWPQPPPAYGPNAQASYRRFWDRIASGRVGQVAKTNPDRAEAIISRIDTQLTYGARGKIMASLFREGRGDQARALAREIISDYRKRNLDQQMFLDFASFTAQLMPLSDDLFVEAWTLALGKNPSSEGRRLVPGKDGGKVGFTGPESVLLGQLHNYRRRAEVLESLASSFPDLYARLEAIGGLEGLMGQMRPSYPEISCAPPAKIPEGTELLNLDLSLEERSLGAFCLLSRMRDQAISAEQVQALRALMAEIRKSNEPETQDDILSTAMPVRLELELLGLVAEHDFEETLCRVGTLPNAQFRYQALIRMVRQLSRSN